MKKTLIIAAVAFVAAVSSFAQGNVNFQGALNQFKVNTNGTAINLAGVNLTLLFSTGTTLPSVDGIALQNAGSGTLGSSFVTNNTTFNISTAWSAILSDGNYFQVQGTNAPGSILAVSSSTGGWSYNAASSFSAPNVTAGVTYYAYVIGWIGSQTTLAAAAAAGDAVGWSQSFQYTPTGGVTGAANSNGLEGKFAVLVPTPEPSTMAKTVKIKRETKQRSKKT